jgi:hypothetical protein
VDRAEKPGSAGWRVPDVPGEEDGPVLVEVVDVGGGDQVAELAEGDEALDGVVAGAAALLGEADDAGGMPPPSIEAVKHSALLQRGPRWR